MGRQRIHFRNCTHGGYERGTHRTPGSDQIAVIKGFFHQFMGDQIQRGVTMGNDGFELPVQTGLDDGRQGITIGLPGR